MLRSQDFSLIKQISHIQNQFLSFKYLAVFPSEYFFLRKVKLYLKQGLILLNEFPEASLIDYNTNH